MGLKFRNKLNTWLTVDGVVWGPAGSTERDQTVPRRSTAIDAAVAAGQLELLSGIAEPGDISILPEVVATGVEQEIEHGLGHIPSGVGLLITYNPDTGYGGGSAKPYEVMMGGHTDTHLKVTVTSGLKFQPLLLS